MESRPQNPEFRNNPENFHPCIYYNDYNFMFYKFTNAKSLLLPQDF